MTSSWSSHRRVQAAAFAAAAFLASWSPAAAQSAAAPATVRDIVGLLVTNQSVQTGDFVKDRAAAGAASEALAEALLVSLSTLPTSASSAGFTYRFNPALGTVERTTANFGPSFVERAATSGRGQAALGVTWQYASFTKLDDFDLEDGTLVTTANRFFDEPAPFDVETLTLDVRSAIVTVFGTVGVTDRLDVGAAVPYVWLDLEGERIDTYRGQSFTQAQATVQTTGFGDVALRAKYRIVEHRGASLAAAGEWRLPTGREEDLLGAGAAAGRVLAVGTVEGQRVALHGNMGWGWGGVSDEFTYAGALTMVASPRVTIAAEFSGRRLGEVGRIGSVSAPHPSISGVETVRLAAEDLGVHVAAAGGSFKWNVWGPWLLKGSLLFPTSTAGLTAPVRMTFGVDYAFGG